CFSARDPRATVTFMRLNLGDDFSFIMALPPYMVNEVDQRASYFLKRSVLPLHFPPPYCSNSCGRFLTIQQKLFCSFILCKRLKLFEAAVARWAVGLHDLIHYSIELDTLASHEASSHTQRFGVEVGHLETLQQDNFWNVGTMLELQIRTP